MVIKAVRMGEMPGDISSSLGELHGSFWYLETPYSENSLLVWTTPCADIAFVLWSSQIPQFLHLSLPFPLPPSSLPFLSYFNSFSTVLFVPHLTPLHWLLPIYISFPSIFLCFCLWMWFHYWCNPLSTVTSLCFSLLLCFLLCLMLIFLLFL